MPGCCCAGPTACSAELTHPAQQGRHVLRLAATTVTTAGFCPMCLGALALHPQVDVEIDERQSARRRFRPSGDGEHDLGIIDGNTGAERLALLPFSRDKLVLVAHASHPLARASRCRSPKRWIIRLSPLRPDNGMQRLSARRAAAGGKLQVRLRVPSFEALYRLVAAGRVWGVARSGRAALSQRRPAGDHCRVS